jgi:hypothetical protein
MHRPSYWLLLLWLFLATAASAAPTAGASAGGSRWALLVGVDDYESPEVNDLLYTVRDVTAVGETLPA